MVQWKTWKDCLSCVNMQFILLVIFQLMSTTMIQSVRSIEQHQNGSIVSRWKIPPLVQCEVFFTCSTRNTQNTHSPVHLLLWEEVGWKNKEKRRRLNLNTTKQNGPIGILQFGTKQQITNTVVSLYQVSKNFIKEDIFYAMLQLKFLMWTVAVCLLCCQHPKNEMNCTIIYGICQCRLVYFIPKKEREVSLVDPSVTWPLLIHPLKWMSLYRQCPPDKETRVNLHHTTTATVPLTSQPSSPFQRPCVPFVNVWHEVGWTVNCQILCISCI